MQFMSLCMQADSILGAGKQRIVIFLNVSDLAVFLFKYIQMYFFIEMEDLAVKTRLVPACCSKYIFLLTSKFYLVYFSCFYLVCYFCVVFSATICGNRKIRNCSHNAAAAMLLCRPFRLQGKGYTLLELYCWGVIKKFV
jgi:hypothetical protein